MKTINLREIAEELNLGVDSFVILDDNPIERALVQREVPEVAVPRLGTEPSDFISVLERGLHFEALTLSAEDRERHASYKANVERETLRTSVVSIADFLLKLGYGGGDRTLR